MVFYDEYTVWPADFSFQTCGAIGPGLDLQGANLKGINLQGADLEGASLEGANLQGISYDEQTRWPTQSPPTKEAITHDEMCSFLERAQQAKFSKEDLYALIDKIYES